MRDVRINVSDPYPCWVEIEIGGEKMKLRHTDLLSLEHAIAEAKRQVLCKLPRDAWHEVSPILVQT